MKKQTARCVRPYFNPSLEAWVLTRHEDVLAAFHSPHLDVDSPDPGTDETQAAQQRIRAEALAALSPAQVRLWSEQTAAIACETVSLLPYGQSVDLLEAYLRPVCLCLATIVTGLSPSLAEDLRELSLPISRAAAEPLDAPLQAAAAAATPTLQAYFDSPTLMLRDSGFVALAHTLPALIANAIYALLLAPQQWDLLYEHPERLEQAVEELMRCAGLTRTTRRRVRHDTVCNGLSLRAGDLLELHIMSANHDRERFPVPDELDLRRRNGGHFTLGAGAHACVAASLIRAATSDLLRPLIAKFASAALTQTVEWQGGSGFQFPRCLNVLLSPPRQ